MKVLLLTPIYFFQRWPLELYFTKLFFRLNPLGLMQLAAYYPKTTTIINGNYKKIKPKQLAKIFAKYNSFNNVIGISCQANVGAINSILTIKLAKKYAPNATIIVGGYHATFFDKPWIKLGADIVIRNETELIYNKILKKIEKNRKIKTKDLQGTTYSLQWLEKKNHLKQQTQNNENAISKVSKWKEIFKDRLLNKEITIIREKDKKFCDDLGVLPKPLRKIINISNESIPIDGEGYSTSIEFARGCPYSCKFCSTPVMWKNKVRFKSIDNLLDEINDCIKMNIKKFFFVDESWGINQYYDEFVELFERKNFEIQWGIQCRVDTIIEKPDLFLKAGKNGCRFALIGFETLNQGLLEKNKKKINIYDFIKVKKIMQESNIAIFGYFIIGLPGETRESWKKTIYYSKTISDIPFIQRFIPYFTGFNKSLKHMNEYKSIFNPSYQNLWKYFYEKKTYKKKYKYLHKDIINLLINLILNPLNYIPLIRVKNPIERCLREVRKNILKSVLSHFISFNPKQIDWQKKYL